MKCRQRYHLTRVVNVGLGNEKMKGLTAVSVGPIKHQILIPRDSAVVESLFPRLSGHG